MGNLRHGLLCRGGEFTDRLGIRHGLVRIGDHAPHGLRHKRADALDLGEGILDIAATVLQVLAIRRSVLPVGGVPGNKQSSDRRHDDRHERDHIGRLPFHLPRPDYAPSACAPRHCRTASTSNSQSWLLISIGELRK